MWMNHIVMAAVQAVAVQAAVPRSKMLVTTTTTTTTYRGCWHRHIRGAGGGTTGELFAI